MAELIVEIRPDGTMKINGEDFQTAAVKREFEKLGEVVERHEGHTHVHQSTPQQQQQRT